MLFIDRMHPDSQECLGRDDFGAAKCILICRKCLAGMNWNREMHPDSQECLGRDDFGAAECILIGRNITPLNQSKYRQAFRIYERNRDTALMEYCIAAGVAKTCEILEDICRKLNVPEVNCP